MSRLELWFQDTFLQHVQPDQLVNPVHPEVKPDPSPPPPPANTGLDYLALLRAEHDRLLQAQLEGIHFSQLTDCTPSPKPGQPVDHSQEATNDHAE